MKPRNTLPKSGTFMDGEVIAFAYPMFRIRLQKYAVPAPSNDREADYRTSNGEMLRRELVAFADSMQRIKNPKQRERLATQAAELLAYIWANEAKTYEQIGRDTIRHVVARRDAVAEVEYLKEAGYALN